MFELNLQLHGNEGYEGGGEQSTESYSPSETSAEETPSEAPRMFGIRKDEATGRTQAVLLDESETQTTQEAPKPKQYSSTQELLEAQRNGTLDESRVPMEVAFQYEAFRRAQEATTPQQEVKPPDPVEFYSKVDETATQAALDQLGITKDDLEVAEYSDDQSLVEKAKLFETAKAYHRGEILKQVEANMTNARLAQQEQERVMGNVMNVIDTLKKNEPNFQAIDQMALNYVQEMPVKDAGRYLDAIAAFRKGSMTQEQANALGDYYNIVRLEYYNKANGGRGRRPPNIEGLGDSRKIPGAPVYTSQDLKDCKDYRLRREIIGYLMTHGRTR